MSLCVLCGAGCILVWRGWNEGENSNPDFADSEKTVIFVVPKKNGPMAEWLGRGLQNLVQRFESASDLREITLQASVR